MWTIYRISPVIFFSRQVVGLPPHSPGSYARASPMSTGLPKARGKWVHLIFVVTRNWTPRSVYSHILIKLPSSYTSWPPTRRSTTLSSKVNLPHAFKFGVLSGANLVTKPPRIRGQQNLRTPPCGDPRSTGTLRR